MKRGWKQTFTKRVWVRQGSKMVGMEVKVSAAEGRKLSQRVPRHKRKGLSSS